VSGVLLFLFSRGTANAALAAVVTEPIDYSIRKRAFVQATPEQSNNTRQAMNEVLKGEIEEIVNRETRAWDTQDVDLLLTVFHPDMVWAWPPTPHAHDPVEWVWGMGRFNAERWRKVYRELFDTHTLVHNQRDIVRISLSPEGDGAVAVVDVDTLWRSAQGVEQSWKGRAGKFYAKVGKEWKMTMHTGLLLYSQG